MGLASEFIQLKILYPLYLTFNYAHLLIQAVESKLLVKVSSLNFLVWGILGIKEAVPDIVLAVSVKCKLSYCSYIYLY